MEQYSYFMIRVEHVRQSPADRHSPTDHHLEPLAGVVERLISGEKQSFADGEELLRLLSRWSDGLNNMRSSTRGGKA